MNKVFGIVLIILGLAGVVWGGFTWTTQKTLVDVGPIHATRNVEHQLPLPPVIGLLALAGGAALLIFGRRV